MVKTILLAVGTTIGVIVSFRFQKVWKKLQTALAMAFKALAKKNNQHSAAPS